MTPKLTSRLSRAAFEARYVASPDPWNFATSSYERDRYDCILRAVMKPRYGNIYEPGCSVGVLTGRLAHIAARVIAIDLAPSAVKVARERCAELANVEIRCESVASFIPSPPPDLIVFSEIGYYFDVETIAHLSSRLAAVLSDGGEFIAAHWLGHSEDHVLHGDAVHESLRSSLPLRWVKGEIHNRFRIDSWVKS